MTSMPELVGAFNGFGGGASALVAGAEFIRVQQSGEVLAVGSGVTIALSLVIGAVTFSGSFVAFGKVRLWSCSGAMTRTEVTRRSSP